MNCRPGDLAIIVRTESEPSLIGRVIKLGCYVENVGSPKLPGFEIQGPPLDGVYRHVADRCVRPIRDQPGDDETLAWAGKPAKVTP